MIVEVNPRAVRVTESTVPEGGREERVRVSDIESAIPEQGKKEGVRVSDTEPKDGKNGRTG